MQKGKSPTADHCKTKYRILFIERKGRLRISKRAPERIQKIMTCDHVSDEFKCSLNNKNRKEVFGQIAAKIILSISPG